MVILASDTSTSHGTVAVRNAGGDIVSVEMDDARAHSETLLAAVDRALSLADIRRGEVEALAVGIGPGAFTGLRVGLATFKGWAYASHLPVIPVPSLDAVAFPVLKGGKGAIVVADARKGEVYACYYPCLDDSGLPKRRDVPVLIAGGEVLSWIESMGDTKAAVLGTGTPFLEGTGVGKQIEAARDYSCYPAAPQILTIGEAMFSMGRAVGPASLVPDYVRLPDAKPQEKIFRSPGT